MTRAVVLARGLGTRMRAADPGAELTPDQHQAADAGLKPMIPVHGRPFMDYILSGLADAGLTDAALIVPPEHDALHRYYATEAPPSRIVVSFVVQQEPLGTADAVLAAQHWTDGGEFLVMNADNLYPTLAVAQLAGIDEPGLLAFDRDDLVRSGNIPADRVRAFALIERDDRGYLTHIVEKPSLDLPPEGGSHEKEISQQTKPAEGGSHEKAISQQIKPAEGGSHENEISHRSQPGAHDTQLVASAFLPPREALRRDLDEAQRAKSGRRKNMLVSMNCWRFDARIFRACRDVPRSARGEFELPEAVGVAIRQGVPFRALTAHGPVLDLSRRADTVAIAGYLAGIVPRP